MSSIKAFYTYLRKFVVVLVVLNFVVNVSGEDQKVAGSDTKLYIVYMGDHPSGPVQTEAAVDAYVDVLSSVKGGAAIARNSIVHSYTTVFKAFAAELSAEEATKLAGMEGVVSVFPNRYHKLHTTKSWDFVGFPKTVKRIKQAESDIVVGLLDTGISPGLESFNDKGFGPPPKSWKGSCRRYANFSGCNNKVIGARYFKFDGKPDPGDMLSPADVNGHGTHTSSTVAGNVVENAHLFGIGKGTARGAVPSARIAMYKVCWQNSGCADVDLLAAFEAAIHDGVDIISISIGGAGPTSYTNDTIALGSFHAMKRGILTVASAGNSGPNAGSVENHAPWMLTVGASGINRQYTSKISLGNGRSINGIGINTFAPKQRLYPLVTGDDVGLNSTGGILPGARYCMDGSLDPKKARGKIVYCELQGSNVDLVMKRVGAAGTILSTDTSLDAAQILLVPGTMVNSTIGGRIEKYIRKTRSAAAAIGKSVEVKIPAPHVASFSSQGPNPGSNKILKPDVVAPGLDILAAYTPLNSLTGLEGDSRHSKFTIMSGTSMSCPHTAGAAAYVKSFHPKWSPAAIRSAIITTATIMTPKSEYDSAFAYGAGHINPRKATTPGLIYDMDATNYIQFLCHEGYNESALGVLMQSKSIKCSSMSSHDEVDAINYPSMQLSMDKGKAKSGSFRRTVTNVGHAQSVYKVTVHAPKGVAINVTPSTLSFNKVGQKRSFTVTVKASAMDETDVLSGAIVWTSGKYVVRSPIAVYTTSEFL